MTLYLLVHRAEAQGRVVETRVGLYSTGARAREAQARLITVPDPRHFAAGLTVEPVAVDQETSDATFALLRGDQVARRRATAHLRRRTRIATCALILAASVGTIASADWRYAVVQLALLALVLRDPLGSRAD